jgi:hypothetical protein
MLLFHFHYFKNISFISVREQGMKWAWSWSLFVYSSARTHNHLSVSTLQHSIFTFINVLSNSYTHLSVIAVWMSLRSLSLSPPSLSQNICLLLPPSFIIQTQASTYLSLSKSFSLSFYVSKYLSVLLVVLWIFFIRHLAILYFLSGSHWSHSSILSIK